VDSKRARQQLEIIRVTVTAEARRMPPDAMRAMRLRASEILNELELAAAGDAELLGDIAATRSEIT
jgi:hypothetical protein